ncbi:CapA family protein [Enterococcus olivae]
MKMIFAGDALFSSRNLKETIDEQVFKKLQSADFAFANAEFVTPKHTTAPAAGRGYQTSVRPETLDEFSDLNIRYVSFANNHTGDYGIEGLLDTIDAAKSRNLVPLGVGYSLSEARKPTFIDSKDGRIGIVTVAVTRSEVFAAADGGNGVVSRPGVNPLRWNRTYVVSEEDFAHLQAIDERIGTAESMRVGKRIETFKGDPNKLDLGSFFEGYLTFEKGEQPGVCTHPNEEDQREILRYIEDAKERSDFVIVNLHTHEGENENWYSDYAPAFIEEFSHLAVEAGANLVVGHGAHFTRGIEIYQQGTIFYNIGSLLMEFEAGESIISPEMFSAYGYATNEVASTLHKNRTKDSEGNWQGFYSDPMFSENFFLEILFDRETDSFETTLVPIDLQLTNARVTKRGLPVLASEKQKASLLKRLNNISQERYQTQVIEKNGVFYIEKSTARD